MNEIYDMMWSKINENILTAILEGKIKIGDEIMLLNSKFPSKTLGGNILEDAKPFRITFEFVEKLKKTALKIDGEK